MNFMENALYKCIIIIIIIIIYFTWPLRKQATSNQETIGFKSFWGTRPLPAELNHGTHGWESVALSTEPCWQLLWWMQITILLEKCVFLTKTKYIFLTHPPKKKKKKKNGKKNHRKWSALVQMFLSVFINHQIMRRWREGNHIFSVWTLTLTYCPAKSVTSLVKRPLASTGQITISLVMTPCSKQTR